MFKLTKTGRSTLAACSLLTTGWLAPTALGQSVPAVEAQRALRTAQILERVHLDDDQHGSTCLETARMSVLFSPQASRSDVETLLDSLPDEEFGFFQLQGSRWTQTATNGATSVGQAITLTYSFFPDGVAINSGASFAASNLIASANANFPGGFSAFRTKVAQAMDRWGELTNITYVEVTDDGAAFNQPGVLGARGDVRIGGHNIGSNALAVNYYPQFGGDMIMDTTDFATFANASSDYRALRNVIAHEHGHGLGLQHVIPQVGTKLMEPALNTGFDGPQEDDIRGAYAVYGDRDEPNAGIGSETFIGGPLRQPSEVGTQLLTRDEIALERSGESDWYAFTAFAGVPIAIRVQPVGTVYEQGPQSGSPTTIDAGAARNLALRLWRRVSSQTGEIQLLAQIDFNDAGEAEYHPPIPYTIAGYMLAEIYSTDGVNDVQRYALSISNSAISPPVEPSDLRVFDDTGAELGDSSTVLFTATPVGQSRNRTLTIANGGTGPLEFGDVTIAGPGAADYSFTLLNDEVPPGGFSSLAITFAPTAQGQRAAVISMPNNDPDRRDFSFIVSGAATAPQPPVLIVTVNGVELAAGDSFDFGDVARTQTAETSLRLRNGGNVTINASQIGVIGPAAADFATSVTSATLVPGATLNATLSVTPSATGPREAQLRIVSNAGETDFGLAANGTPLVDCNANGAEDADDIAAGTSTDCDLDSVPDECQLDSDADGLIDACDACPNGEDLRDSDADGRNDCEDAFPNDPFDGQPPTDDDTNPGDNGNDNGNGNDKGGNDNNNGNDDQDVDGGDDTEEMVEEVLRPVGCGFGAPLGMALGLAALTSTRFRRKRRVS